MPIVLHTITHTLRFLLLLFGLLPTLLPAQTFTATPASLEGQSSSTEEIPTTYYVDIQNNGPDATLYYDIEVPGIKGAVYPDSPLFIPAGQSRTIMVDLRISLPRGGTATSEIVLFTRSRERLVIPVKFSVTPPVIAIDRYSQVVDFDPGVDSQVSESVHVEALNGEPLCVRVTPTPPWFRVTYKMPSPSSAVITAHVDSTGLPYGYYSYTTGLGVCSQPENITGVAYRVFHRPLTLNTELPLHIEAVSGGNTSAGTFVIHNPGLDVKLTSSSDRPWLFLVGNRRGTGEHLLQWFGDSQLVARVDPEALPPGTHAGTLKVLPENRPPFHIPVVVKVVPGTLEASTNEIVLTGFAGGGDPAPVRFSVHGRGQVIPFTAAGASEWLTASPASGRLGRDEPTVLMVGAKTQGMPEGEHRTSLVVGGFGTHSIEVPVVVRLARASLSVSPASLEISAASGRTGVAHVTVYANGPVGVRAEVDESAAAWLSVNPPAFDSFPQLAQFRANARNLAPGTYRATVRFRTAQEEAAVDVTLMVRPAQRELTVWPPRLDFRRRETGGILPQSIMLDSGPTSVGYSVKVTGGTDWLSVEPSSETTPAALTIRAAPLSGDRVPASATVHIQPKEAGYDAVEVPVTQTERSAPYVFPHVVSGGGYETEFRIRNRSAIDATMQFKFLRSVSGSGRATEDWSPQFEGEAPDSGKFIVPARSMRVLRTAGVGDEAVSGWTILFLPANLDIHADIVQRRPGSAQRRAAVAPTRHSEKRVFVPFDHDDGQETSIVIVNREPDEESRVRAAIRASDGEVLSVEDLGTVPGHGRLVVTATKEWPALRGERGVIDLVIEGGSAAVSAFHFHKTGAYTSVPVAPAREDQGRGLAAAQVAFGGGFRTTLVLVNQEAVASPVRVEFRRNVQGAPDTRPWNLEVNGIPNPVDYVIPPGGVLTLTTPGGNEEVQSGWAEILSPNRVSGHVAYELHGTGNTVQVAAASLAEQDIFRTIFPFNSMDGNTTTAAIANTSDEASDVSLSAFDEQGVLLQRASIRVPGRGYAAFAVTEHLPMATGRGFIDISGYRGRIARTVFQFTGDGAMTLPEPGETWY